MKPCGTILRRVKCDFSRPASLFPVRFPRRFLLMVFIADGTCGDRQAQQFDQTS